jgi:hypothetical protein
MGWGWLGTLGKVGAGIAAPLTGGASLAAIPAIDALSKSTGAASQAQASNRGTKAGLMMDQNSDLERELLARQQETRSARNDAYQNAIRGSIAYSYDPSKQFDGLPSKVPHLDVTGGTMGNPQAHAAGDELVKQSMNRLTQPDLQTAGGGSMPAYRNLWNDPEFQKTLNPSLMEKILGYTSAFSPILGMALGKGENQSQYPAATGHNTPGSVVKG